MAASIASECSWLADHRPNRFRSRIVMCSSFARRVRARAAMHPRAECGVLRAAFLSAPERPTGSRPRSRSQTVVACSCVAHVVQHGAPIRMVARLPVCRYSGYTHCLSSRDTAQLSSHM